MCVCVCVCVCAHTRAHKPATLGIIDVQHAHLIPLFPGGHDAQRAE